MKIHNDTISASAIKTYLHCPFQYYLSYILKYRSPETFATLNGTIIHSTLEKFGVGHRSKWLMELLWRYKKHQPWKLLADFKNHGACKGCEILEALPFYHGDIFADLAVSGNFLDKLYEKCPIHHVPEAQRLIKGILDRDPCPFDYEIIEAEKKFTLPIGYGINITGFIDLVSKLDDNTIEIRDWKTGNWVPSYEDAYNDPQLRIYDLAASILYPEYPIRLLTFDYIKKQRYTFVISDEEREFNQKWIISVAKKIQEDFNPKRNLTYKCKTFCMPQACDKEWPKKLITIKKLQKEDKI